MSDSPRDNNRVPAGLGVSSADSVTPTNFGIDPLTGRLLTDNVIEPLVTAAAGTPKLKDSNRVNVAYGYDYDNNVLIPIYISPTGGVLEDVVAE